MMSFLSPDRRAAGPREGGRDRRTASRYTADGAVLLGWWDGPEFRSIPAAMKDVSIGGAAVIVGKRPPKEVPIWFHLDRPAAPDWAEATVRAVGADRKGLSFVRLEFVDPCPYKVFTETVSGIELAGRPDHASPEFNGRDWR